MQVSRSSGVWVYLQSHVSPGAARKPVFMGVVVAGWRVVAVLLLLDVVCLSHQLHQPPSWACVLKCCQITRL